MLIEYYPVLLKSVKKNKLGSVLGSLCLVEQYRITHLI